MEEKALVDLEFDKVLELLVAQTSTPPGASLARDLRPLFDGPEVVLQNALTAEAAKLATERGALPHGTVPDPQPLLARLEIEGSVLAPLEVVDLLTLMKSGRALKAFLAESRAGFPRLWEVGRQLPELGNLIRFLDGKVASTGELEDQASDELHAIRQEIRRRNERLKLALDAIVGRPGVARALQDDFISIRSERHVLPIRAEAQTALQGIVHGVSGSGATVFIEPIETVDLNNEIVTLRDREAAEVQRLLQEYSSLLRGRLAELRALGGGIGRLDLLMAKARLGERMGARPAEPASSGELILSGARHPLVEASLRAQGGSIVPLDLEIQPGLRVLVISGPNTGGKTVTLKTAGLLALMFQSGLPVPAGRAVLPVFREIFIDIGDRQSIPERLSTFSARMKNVSEIAAKLRPPGLVLLDEVGTGTDPEDGVALAIAIIDYFRDQAATVIATTHLEALKAFTATTPGCANAAMQFDERTFSPTYRLIPGIPGRSGGLEIAERLGLPAEILQQARARRGQSGQRIASYLARLQELSSDLESRLAALDRDRQKFEEERARLNAALGEREEQGRRAVTAEVEMALRSIREEGERYLASIKDRELAVAMRREEEKAATRLRAEARHLIRRLSGSPPPEPTPGDLTPGSKVAIEGLGVQGTVERVRGERVVVLVRNKRMTVPLADCRAERQPAVPGHGPRLPRRVTLSRRQASEVPPEIRLLGRTVDDALSIVDKYLDDAYLAGLSPVRLVHGVGSGRLMRAIADLLSHHPQVEAFHPAPADQGGTGVTVVDLRL